MRRRGVGVERSERNVQRQQRVRAQAPDFTKELAIYGGGQQCAFSRGKYQAALTIQRAVLSTYSIFCTIISFTKPISIKDEIISSNELLTLISYKSIFYARKLITCHKNIICSYLSQNVSNGSFHCFIVLLMDMSRNRNCFKKSSD